VSAPNPPRLARQFLSDALPPDAREGIVGDLDEVFRQRCSRDRAFTALWYCGQVLAIAARFGPERVSGLARTFASSVGLDLRLGLRMLIKYPMLTVIGSIAITVTATISIGAAEFLRDLWIPKLPLDEPDRIVQLSQREEESGTISPSLFDFVTWRESLESIEDLGAFQTQEQSLTGPRGETGTVSLARLTASTLRLTRVAPARGRLLTDEDELAGAPPVVVLGWDVWQGQLGGDPGVVGSTVEIGGSPASVIGVMPEGFGFPMRESAWVPLRLAELDLAPASAQRVQIVGRLAPGVSRAAATEELGARGASTAQAFPVTHGSLQPQLRAYPTDVGAVTFLISGVRVLLTFLLLVACANVATLVFARTVTREGEIAVRMSLGATRRRIVLQLFTEALVLVSVSTLLALLIVRTALPGMGDLFFVIQQQPTPFFWWNDQISTMTIVYAGVLTLVGALMVGVVPALKATAGDMRPRLSELSSGAGRLRFGGIWTAIIVFQVALSVAFLPIAVERSGVVFRPLESSFPATEYVTAQLGRDAVAPLRSDAERDAFREASRQLFEDVKARVAADPDVQSVAFASGLSGLNHIRTPVEFVGDAEAPAAGESVRTLLVDADYLPLMGARIVAGRNLVPADFVPGSHSVLVNEMFVERVLAGRNAVGGQLRYPVREGESSIVTVPAVEEAYEIVGVVENPGVDGYGPGAHPVVYAPLSLAPVNPREAGLVGAPAAPATQLFVHMRPGAEPIGPKLYAILATVDPSLRLSEMGTIEDAWGPARLGENIAAWIFMGLAAIVLMLSVAGIYALMSFTVSRRTREIAIRTSVGARPGRIIAIIFGRAFMQLALGVALGSLIAVPALRDGVASDGPRALLIVVTVLLVAGLGACLLPVRRALRIQPADAIKTT
jgi:putative ABC transport system permease protein